MFPGRNVTESYDRSAEICQSKTVETFLGKFRDRNAKILTIRNAPWFPDSSARVFQESIVQLSQKKIAEMFPDKNADLFPDNLARILQDRFKEKTASVCLKILYYYSKTTVPEHSKTTVQQ